MKENRENSRINVRWLIELYLEDQDKIEGEVRNISKSGLLIYTKDLLEIDHTYRMAIFPPEQDYLPIVGKIIRSEPYAKDKNQKDIFSGISIVEVKEEDSHFLDRFLDQ
ncbi:MAG: PilZ domain-containing protein [Deltaproteobacteria bacterium]|nr:PilZ domain-containing protein [Deltaproteobacteria bacterium]MBW1911619.1 PilZ domain-containing protein [Deltaproteobacteria bacterium]